MSTYSPSDEDFFVKNLESTKKPRYRQTPSSDIPDLEEEYGEGYDEHFSGDDYIIKRSRTPLVIIFIIFIVIGIIVNLFLLFGLDGRDRNGKIITNDEKTMAAINSIGLAVLLSIILGGFIFIIWGKGNNTNMGLGFVLLLLVAFVIIFLMGLLAGEYVNVGHLWAPLQVVPANIS